MNKVKLTIDKKNGNYSLNADGVDIPWRSITIEQDFNDKTIPILKVENYIRDLADVEIDCNLKLYGLPIDTEMALELYERSHKHLTKELKII